MNGECLHPESLSLRLKQIKTKTTNTSENNRTQMDTSFMWLCLKLLPRRQCGDLCSQPWSWHRKVSLWEIGKVQKFHQWLSGHTQYRMSLLWKKLTHYLWHKCNNEAATWYPAFLVFNFFFLFFFFSDVVHILVTKIWTVINTEKNVYIYIKVKTYEETGYICTEKTVACGLYWGCLAPLFIY